MQLPMQLSWKRVLSLFAAIALISLCVPVRSYGFSSSDADIRLSSLAIMSAALKYVRL